MWSYYVWLLTLVTLVISNPRKMKEEHRCLICKSYSKCRLVISYDYSNKIWSQRCGTRGGLFCCENLKPRVTISEATTTTSPTTTTPTSTTTLFTTVPPTTTPANTTENPIAEFGRKSKEKCHEYSKWLDVPILSSGSKRIPGLCGIFNASNILDQSASYLEFPHMALLGYEKTSSLEIDYRFSASLISEQYLLTTAHSLKGANGPFVAKLGNGNDKFQKIVKLGEQIPHPEYTSPLKYNDIGLIRLEKPITFTDYIRPACLQTEKITASEVTVVESFFKRGTEYVLKKSLPILNHSQCSEIYPRNFYLQSGIDDESMMCAGIINGNNDDECQDNAGGPLQIIKKKPHCMYGIVAIASFGKHCSVFPDVYTKVSTYIPWVETIVWPDKE